VARRTKVSDEITIHGYPNGGIPGTKPRVPMVHVLVSNGNGTGGSITFHPVYAESVANSILRAAKAARAGRKISPIKLAVSDSQ
jgi:hypothetical protein